VSENTVVWTSEALDDLLNIEAFIEDARKAEKIIDQIIDKTRQLQQFPLSGKKLETQTKQEYRFLLTGNYKIIYSFRKDTVYIHTIFDSRQDPGKLKV
jgi:plasmid stabilization system protein ParE